jgi:arabinofuranosyltransferase
MKKSSKKTSEANRQKPGGKASFESQGFQKGLLYGCLLLYGVVLVRTAWLCDDAYITFRTVDNFLNGYGLRWNIAERVQSYTHPLWMFVLSLCSFVTREFYLTPIVLSLFLSFAAVLVLARKAGGRTVSAALGVFVLVLSKAFIDYSTSGLENPLTYCILALFFICSLKDSFDEKHLLQLSVLACLGILNRMDTALFFAPTLAYGLIRFGRVKGIGIVLAGFIPFFVWELFSLIYYGYLVPNTAFAKMNTGISRGEYLAQGMSYYRNSLVNDPLTLAAIVYALLMVFVCRARRFFPHAAGILLYLGYIVWIGGDFMSGRFFAAPLVLAVAMLVAGNFFIPARYLAAAAVIVAVLGFSVPTATIFSGSDYGKGSKIVLDEHGIANEREFYFENTGLINNSALQGKPKIGRAHV